MSLGELTSDLWDGKASLLLLKSKDFRHSSEHPIPNHNIAPEVISLPVETLLENVSGDLGKVNLMKLSYANQGQGQGPFCNVTAEQRLRLIHELVAILCPNLHRLELEIGPDDFHNFSRPHPEIIRFLKLTELTLTDRQDSCKVTRNWIVSLLKNSPTLKTLKVRTGFFKEGEIEIYKNLLEASSFGLGEQIEEFSCELFRLTKGENNQGPSAFRIFLGTLTNLKKLSLSGINHLMEVNGTIIHNGSTGSISQLPNAMKFLSSLTRRKLSHLELNDIWKLGIETKDKRKMANFLQSFPNLSDLKVDLQSRDSDKNNKRGLIFLGVTFLQENPLIKVKSLTVTDCCAELSSEQLSSAFVKSFPNLEYLNVGIINGWKRDGKPKPCDLMEIFTALEELEKLRELKLAACVEKKEVIAQALSFLPRFPYLESVSIYVWRGDLTGAKRVGLDVLRGPLLGLRHLRSIELKKRQIFRSELDNLQAFAAANNIPLKLTDFPEGDRKKNF